jgi:hypothetical protein
MKKAEIISLFFFALIPKQSLFGCICVKLKAHAGVQRVSNMNVCFWWRNIRTCFEFECEGGGEIFTHEENA